MPLFFFFESVHIFVSHGCIFLPLRPLLSLPWPPKWSPSLALVHSPHNLSDFRKAFPLPLRYSPHILRRLSKPIGSAPVYLLFPPSILLQPHTFLVQEHQTASLFILPKTCFPVLFSDVWLFILQVSDGFSLPWRSLLRLPKSGSEALFGAPERPATPATKAHNHTELQSSLCFSVFPSRLGWGATSVLHITMSPASSNKYLKHLLNRQWMTGSLHIIPCNQSLSTGGGLFQTVISVPT